MTSARSAPLDWLASRKQFVDFVVVLDLDHIAARVGQFPADLSAQCEIGVKGRRGNPLDACSVHSRHQIVVALFSRQHHTEVAGTLLIWRFHFFRSTLQCELHTEEPDVEPIFPHATQAAPENINVENSRLFQVVNRERQMQNLRVTHQLKRSHPENRFSRASNP